MPLALIGAILAEFSSVLLAFFVGNSFLTVKPFLDESMLAASLFTECKEDLFVFAIHTWWQIFILCVSVLWEPMSLCQRVFCSHSTHGMSFVFVASAAHCCFASKSSQWHLSDTLQSELTYPGN